MPKLYPIFSALLFIVAVGLTFGLTIQPVYAASFVVTSVTDSDDGTCDADCTLREAINAANATTDDDTITFNLSGSFTTTNTPLIINHAATIGALTIDGTGQTVTITSNGTNRDINVTSGGNLTLQNLTITGGGIYNDGMLRVNNVTFTANTSNNDGGGINNYGTLTVTNSTFSANTANNFGGGINNHGTLTVNNSTFSANTAIDGSGINNYGTLTLYNSIVANGTNGGDCLNSSAADIQYSLIEDASCNITNGLNGNLTGDPNLGTFTGVYYPLNAGSISIDAGSDSLVPSGVTLDQIGNSRFDGIVDLGAIEYVHPPVPSVTISPTSATLAEGDNTDFIITRTGDTSADLVVAVNLTLGTAMNSPGDYTLSGGSITGQTGSQTVTIPAGSATVAVNFAALTDVAGAEADNTLTLDLVDGGSYDLGTDAQTIATIPAHDFTVVNFAENGEGSLRQAITNANTISSNDTITFATSGTLSLTSALPDIENNGKITIDGAGAITIQRSSSAEFRLFTFASGVDATLNGLNLYNGYLPSGNGGAIFADDVTLTVTNSRIENSYAGNGGAIYSSTNLTVINTLLRNNQATGDGGGIYNRSGTATVINTTFSENLATSGGGIYNLDSLILYNVTLNRNGATTGGGINSADIATLYNSIVANSTSGGDCATSGGSLNAIDSLIQDGLTCVNGVNSGNLTGDPGLGTFTGTYYPPANANSPIVDAGSNSLIPGGVTTDQVGNPRIQGDSVDLGAYESSYTYTPLVNISPSIVNVAEGANADITITRTGSTSSALTVSLFISQNSIASSDYTLSGGNITGQSGNQTIVIPAGQASVTVNFAATEDVDAETGNALLLSLNDAAAYDVGAQGFTTAFIAQNDLVVTNLNDSGDGSLRQAITNANTFGSDDTITFTVSGTIPLSSALPALANNGILTINGGGSITLQGGSFSIMTLADGSNVALNGLTFTGASTGLGGGVYMNTGTLSVTNSGFSGNIANGGGGIHNENGTLHVTGSQFTNNMALNGGGILNRYGQTTIINSTFSGNATNSLGGGAYNQVGTMTIINSTFSGLKSNGWGAGIYNSGTIYVYNSTFSNNDASGYAADFYNTATASLYNSIFANAGGGANCTNIATMSIQYTLIEDGSCGITNGVNGNKTGDPNLGTFSGQYYPLNAGSTAIDAGNNSLIPGGITTDQAGNTRIQNSTVDMGAYESAAPINYVSINPTSASISEGTNANITLTRAGGSVSADLTVSLMITRGLDTDLSDYTLSNAAITGQENAQTVTIPAGQASVDLNVAVADDAMAEGENQLIIDVIDGTSYDLGTNTQAVISIPQNDLVVTNLGNGGDGSLRQAVNNALTAGGTVDATGIAGTIALVDPIEMNGDLTIDGPGAANLTVSITGDRVFHIFGGTVLFRSFTISGGGIQVDNGNVTIGNSPMIITGNHTNVCGGGLLVTGGTVTVQAGSQITGNTTTDNGGGICVTGGSLIVQGAGTQIANNHADNSGGGIYVVSPGSVTVQTSTTIEGNTANNLGGGIYNGGGTLSVTNSYLFNNVAAAGDAVYSTNAGSVTNSCIVGNGDTAVVNTSGTLSATGNWWGTDWGPNIADAPTDTGSYVSSGDSIGGTGEATSSVSVNMTMLPTHYGTFSNPPTGDWVTVAPANCGTCNAPSGNGFPRVCVDPRP